MHKKIGVRKIAYTALCTALIIVGGFVRFPIGAVPITLQTLFVLLAGSVCGSLVGALSSFIYIALGLIGLPIFSAGGGIMYVLYPTFGYLLSFVVAGFISGLAKKSLPKKIGANIGAVLVIHLIGVIYFYLMSNLYLKGLDTMHSSVMGNPIYEGAEISLWQAFLTGSLVFLPLDVLSAIISAIIGYKVEKIINKG